MKKKKVLVIDDTIHVLDEIGDILEMEDFEVIKASDAFQGMQLIGTEKPDLIITDVLMPEMDGFNLIEKIKSIPKFSSIPIIVMSAQATTENQSRSTQLHADRFLGKPCSIDDLLDTVKSLTENTPST